MRRALLIIGFAGLACGSQETSTSTTSPGATGSQTPPVSAVQPPAAQPPSDAAMPEEGAEPVDAVEVTTCLALVDAGKYGEAVVACQTAVNLYPDNAKAAAALAKAGASTAAGAASAAADAAQGAADAAQDAADAVKP